MYSLTRQLIPFLLLGGEMAYSSGFSYFTTVRAGFWGNLADELEIGGTANAPASTASYNYSGGTPYWRGDNLPHNFQIGYVAASNTGFLRVFDSANVPTTVSFNPAVTLVNPSAATWTLPAANFFVQATNTIAPSSITVDSLAFSAGVTVLSGSLPASLTAAQNGTNVTASAPAPIVFNPASSGGNWTLSGVIRFTGLFGYSGFAFGDTLRFDLGATATDNPEPQTYVLISLGLLGAGFIGNRRASGFRK